MIESLIVGYRYDVLGSGRAWVTTTRPWEEEETAFENGWATTWAKGRGRNCWPVLPYWADAGDLLFTVLFNPHRGGETTENISPLGQGGAGKRC